MGERESGQVLVSLEKFTYSPPPLLFLSLQVRNCLAGQLLGAGGKSRSKVTAIRAHLSGEHRGNSDSPAGPFTPWEVTALQRQERLGMNFKPKNNNEICWDWHTEASVGGVYRKSVGERQGC